MADNDPNEFGAGTPTMRDYATDAGRKGTSATHKTKASHGFVMRPFEAKGDWEPAYGGGMGSPSSDED